MKCIFIEKAVQFSLMCIWKTKELDKNKQCTKLIFWCISFQLFPE